MQTASESFLREAEGLPAGTPCRHCSSALIIDRSSPLPTDNLFQEMNVQTYLLENPWPIGLVSGSLMLILLIAFLRQGDGRLGVAALVALVVTGGVFGLDYLVTTPAEHGERVVGLMVESAEEGDPDAVLEHVAPDASLHLGDIRRPGRSFKELERSLRSLERANRITDNWVTRLSGENLGEDRAIVSLACITTTTSSYGSVPTTWSFELERGDDGTWKVTRVVFESLMGKPPSRPI